MVFALNFKNFSQYPLVLASSSSTRAQILRDAGLVFEIEYPSIDENKIKQILKLKNIDPSDQVMILAKSKAESISQRNPEKLVIGADQILDLHGEVFDKAPNLDVAKQQLLILRGQEHQLLTGCVIALNGYEIWRNFEYATMTMRSFSEEFINEYLNILGHRILSVVGGYHIEGLGIHLFSSINGDSTTIRGLTILPLVNFIREYAVNKLK